MIHRRQTTTTVDRVLSSYDDYPVHQTTQPIAKTISGDLNHYDRYFFNGYTMDTRLFFAAALGLYPNRHIVDGAFSVVIDGGTDAAQQVNVHASRRAPHDRSEATSVGPIKVEVLEPLTVLRITVDAPEHRLKADLTFRRRTAPIKEPHFFHQVGNRVVMDSTRMTQFGSWEGWVEVDEELIDLTPGETLGCRDRSWGVRRVGERIPEGAPVANPQFFWLWAPINFRGFATHFDINELSDGRRWHESGFVALAPHGADSDLEQAEEMRAVDVRLEWRPGTRAIAWAEIDLTPWQGEPSTVRLVPRFDWHMSGVGYLHPEWSHGVWKGEIAVDGDRWNLPVDDMTLPHHVHIQTIVTATTSGSLGVHEGIGVLEQLAIGQHSPTGLRGLFEGFDPDPSYV